MKPIFHKISVNCSEQHLLSCILPNNCNLNLTTDYLEDNPDSCTKAIEALKNHAELENVYSIEFSGLELPNQALTDLFNQANCRNIRELHFNNCIINAAAIATLAQSPYFSGLQVLEFKDCNLSPMILRFIANSDKLKSLRSFDFCSDQVTGEGSREIAVDFLKSVNFKRLEHLGLHCKSTKHRLYQDMYRFIISHLSHPEVSSNFESLTSLDLNNALNVQPNLYKGNNIFIRDNRVSHRDCAVQMVYRLFPSKNLQNLTSLNLDDCNITDKVLHGLLSSDFCKNLTYLSIRHNDLTYEGYKELATTDRLEKLESLDLSGNKCPVSYRVAKEFLGANYPCLEKLSIGDGISQADESVQNGIQSELNKRKLQV